MGGAVPHPFQFPYLHHLHGPLHQPRWAREDVGQGYYWSFPLPGKWREVGAEYERFLLIKLILAVLCVLRGNDEGCCCSWKCGIGHVHLFIPCKSREERNLAAEQLNVSLSQTFFGQGSQCSFSWQSACSPPGRVPLTDTCSLSLPCSWVPAHCDSPKEKQT